MPNDLTSAMVADRRQLVNRAFKTVKDVPTARRDDLKGFVVIVPAHCAFCHPFASLSEKK